MMAYDYPHPVSRTYQYKKITKPLLERKRRARINRCLEELKDLMVDALETEGENISKLEKADILELTVRHLQRLQTSRPSGLSSTISNEDAVAESRWQSGFGHCATEACKYLASLSGESGEKLARHLATGLQSAQKMTLRVKSMKVASASQGKSDINTHYHQPITTVVPVPSPMEVSSSSLSTSSILSSTSSPSILSSTSSSSLSPTSSTSPLNVLTSQQLSSPINPVSYPEKYKEVDQYQILNNAPNAIEVAEESYSPVCSSRPGPSTSVPIVISTNLNENNNNINNNNKLESNVLSEKLDKNEDDEEIDVEGIDETDPMWRPW